MSTLQLGQRFGVNARKRNIDTPFNVANAGNLKSRWINTIDATGGEQVTFFDVGAGRYNFQLNHGHTLQHVAVGDVALACSAVQNRDALLVVG